MTNSERHIVDKELALAIFAQVTDALFANYNDIIRTSAHISNRCL